MSNIVKSNSTNELTWHVVVKNPGDPSLTSADHNLLLPALNSLKSFVFTTSRVNGVFFGTKTNVRVLASFLNDPGVAAPPFGYGLFVEVLDGYNNSMLLLSDIGGTASDPSTGLPPITGITGGPAGFGLYGADIVQPQLKVYTTGYALVTGTIDIRSSASPGFYGPGGTLIGASFNVTSEQGSVTVTIPDPVLNEDDFVNVFINQTYVIGVYPSYNTSGHMVLANIANQTPTGSVSIDPGASATMVGFAGGASMTDGCPTFGQLDPSALADVSVSVFITPTQIINI